MGVKMIKDLITLVSGVLIGVVMVIVIYLIDCPKQTEVKENMSLQPPRELPKDEIEFTKIKLPENLTEVIL